MKKMHSFCYLILVILTFSACAPKQPPLPVTQLSVSAVRDMKNQDDYWIEVQIPQRKLILAKGDHIIKSFPIAVGMPTYQSPLGWKKINRVIWNPWWHPPKTSDWVEDSTPVPPRDPDNPLGELKMPLGNSYLIHGTKAVRSIGQWASHGCVRMMFEDIFGLVQLLMTAYSDQSAIDAMEKANRNPNEEFSTSLNAEVPVHLSYEPVKVRDGFVTISPDFYNRYPDLVGHISSLVKPQLSEEQILNDKKISTLLQDFKDQTIHIPVDMLVE